MTRAGDATVAEGRLRKAIQFYAAAIDVGELADDEAAVRDAVVTLLVHAGIAAADVVCVRRLGEYALGNDDHGEATALLRRVTDPDGSALAKALGRLLGLKTKAGYTHQSVSATDRKRAERAAAALVEAARAV